MSNILFIGAFKVQMPFFLIKCKIGEPIHVNFLNYCTYECVWFKHVFDVLNYKFWLCVFNRSCSCLCDGEHG
jgi:hypothetical protein